MTKKESLDFLQSTLDKIDKTTDEEIKRLEKIYDENCNEQIKDQKLCSNEKTCIHPNCKRCGTTHFVSECDYKKEQK